MKFFNKLPTIQYNGQIAKNFLARVRLTQETLDNRQLFYPYTQEENDRVDHISYKYYNDSDYMWLIYLANDTIDPYFDVFLRDVDFDNLIVKKYGSIANASQQIALWRNNWVTDDTEITISYYENTLPAALKKYWDPIVNEYNIVQGYERKKEDWIIDTNKMVQCTISNVTGTFEVGERVTQRYSNNLITANAVVSYSNTSAIAVKHVVGDNDILASNSSVILTLTGISSGATANIQTTYTTVNISVDEAQYWSPVSYYEYEMEQNAQKKTFNLVDVRAKNTIETQLKKAFGQ